MRARAHTARCLTAKRRRASAPTTLASTRATSACSATAATFTHARRRACRARHTHRGAQGIRERALPARSPLAPPARAILRRRAYTRTAARPAALSAIGRATVRARVYVYVHVCARTHTLARRDILTIVERVLVERHRAHRRSEAQTEHARTEPALRRLRHLHALLIRLIARVLVRGALFVHGARRRARAAYLPAPAPTCVWVCAAGVGDADRARVSVAVSVPTPERPRHDDVGGGERARAAAARAS